MPTTLVLDTNAWLDLLVFRSDVLRPLHAGVAAGDARIAVDDRALAELDRVLGYPVLRLTPGARQVVLDAAKSLGTRIEAQPPKLPRCRDPDDQMFLEIAVSAGAAWLLTRDLDLLRMARRMSREHGVAIATPAQWHEATADQISKR